MDTYLIRYKKPNSLKFGIFLKDSKLNKKVLVTKKFIPGINTVSDEELESLKENDLFSVLLGENENTMDEKAVLEWVNGSGPDDEKPAPSIKQAIDGLTPTKAIKIIKETYSKELLISWREVDKREKVLKFIDAQIDKIQFPKGNKKSGNNHNNEEQSGE